MQIMMNGEVRDFSTLTPVSSLADLIAALALKGDRIAVEHNGSIVARKEWSERVIAENDKLEIVHFVGGGSRTDRFFQSAIPVLLTALFLAASGGAAAPPDPLPVSAGSAAAQGNPAQATPLYSAEAVNGKPTIVVSEIKPGADLKIIAYGDSRFTTVKNTSDASPRPRKWLVDRVAAEAPDAVFFSGDMPFHGDDPADWLIYQQETAPWRAAHLRIFPTIGNHEVTLIPRLGLQNYFANFPYLHEHRWYSVEIGNVYLIVLDSLWSPLPGSEQRAWLEAQLASLPSTVDFVFFLSHMPLVTDLQTQMAVGLPTPEQIDLRNYIESESPKFHAKFVVVNGHIHNYERFERKGVTYVVSGGGGAKPYPVIIRGDQDLYRQPGFPNFHYLVFQIHGKHASVTMNRIADPQAEVMTSEIKDTFTLDAK